jgi:hypothetical protein
MESGLYLSVFSSWEVIAACLFVMFLLPFVFFVASTRSRRRIPLGVRRLRAPTKKRIKSPPPPPAEDKVTRGARPSTRREERPAETEKNT